MPNRSDLIRDATPPTPLVEVRSLSVTYRGRRRTTTQAVQDASLRCAQGEIVGLVGETGCGKTTLGKAMLALVPVVAGQVLFHGVDLHAADRKTLGRLRSRMGIVFQDARLSLNPGMTVGRIIADPLLAHGVINGASLVDHVVGLLAQVGLGAELLHRYPHQLSGGQRQRVGIARAIALEPEFIVCDEPVSALDVSVQAQVLNVLVDLRDRKGLAMLFISHDLAVIERISDTIAVMHAGRIVETGPAASVLESPRHPYTLRLRDATWCQRPLHDTLSDPIDRMHRQLARNQDLAATSFDNPDRSKNRIGIGNRLSNDDTAESN